MSVSDIFEKADGAGQSGYRQVKDGKSFILDAPTTVPAIWGEEAAVLWSEGESLFLVGPQGVGKSTVAQQVALARAGILKPELLGFPVKADESGRVVLYLACDRPKQIGRSLRRMVTEAHADRLLSHVKVWQGPLPFDLVRDPERLAVLAEELGAGTVIVDSLKDIAWPLTGDEAGAAVNRAFGSVVAAGIELAVVHHQRKSNSDNKKPNALDDVYGSTWLTAGAGSVMLLWGEAGDPVVELTHLKQPVDDVGPLEIEHDHDRGTTSVRDRKDAWTVLQDAGLNGVTAQDAAVEIYGSGATRPQVEKTRRKLQRFVKKELATSAKNGPLQTDPVVFRRVAENDRVEPRVVTRVGTRELHGATRTPVNTDHGSYTDPIRPIAPPLRGPGKRERVAVPKGPPLVVADCDCQDGTTEHDEHGRCAQCAGWPQYNATTSHANGNHAR